MIRVAADRIVIAGPTARIAKTATSSQTAWPGWIAQSMTAFPEVSALQALLARSEGVARLAEDYSAEGAVFTVRLEERRRADFERALWDATRGRAGITPHED